LLSLLQLPIACVVVVVVVVVVVDIVVVVAYDRDDDHDDHDIVYDVSVVVICEMNAGANHMYILCHTKYCIVLCLICAPCMCFSSHVYVVAGTICSCSCAGTCTMAACCAHPRTPTSSPPTLYSVTTLHVLLIHSSIVKM